MQKKRLSAMRKEAAVARIEAELAEQGVRIVYPETEVAPSEAKACVAEPSLDAVRRADEAARALLAEEEAEAALRTAAKLAEAEARNLAAKAKALALEQKQRVAEEKRVLAEQKAREKAEAKRLARLARKAAASGSAGAASPAEVDAGLDAGLEGGLDAAGPPPEPQHESRFSKLFAAVEQKRHLALQAGYGLFMSRFGLVPTHSERGEDLVVGETDEKGTLVACGEVDRCARCFEKRATHMYVPCGHLCVCRDCAASCDGGLACAGCTVTPTTAIFVHGHEYVNR